MNKLLIIGLVVFGLLILAVGVYKISNGTPTGTAKVVSDSEDNNVQKISDIQKTENVGKIVTVKGKVINTLQSAVYHISGYKIQDSTGTIDVSSLKIPQVNTTVTVTGNLYQSRYFGLVINETG
jgi:hypothetical protein